MDPVEGDRFMKSPSKDYAPFSAAVSTEHREAMAAFSEAAPPENVGEATWIEVIRKMDEVYSDLLQYQVALEEKNTALEETQQFLQSVLDSMSDVLVVCDRHGRIQNVNRALLRLLQRREEELVGTGIGELCADEASRELVASFSLNLADAVVEDCEIHLLASDGSALSVAVNCTPRNDPQGRSVGMVIIGRPIGELRRAYEALHETHEELKRTQQQLIHSEKMASLGRLVAGVAHELNNPISFVLGNVFAMKRYGERLQTYLDSIHQEDCNPTLCREMRKELRIDRILDDLGPLIEGTLEGAERTRDIVDGLKRFSVVEEEEERPFNLAEVIQQSVHWVTKAAPSGFEVSIDVPDSLPACGTVGHLQQVLINLVQNALDATRESPRPRLEIGGRVEEERLIVTLHDNGPGIAEENLGRIFDPFFTTKPVGQGTGLGLSISYGIVERHGGTLEAANHPEGGALFTLVLPRCQK
ncbi:MAG: ATP-binding protein [Gammaproteobacteria bacterium]